jgi:hypothetical protein
MVGKTFQLRLDFPKGGSRRKAYPVSSLDLVARESPLEELPR